MRYDRDEVLARVDLTALADSLLGPRHPRTRSWRCPNPSHSQTGRTPPVSVFIDRRGGERWHCHGCGEGGTAIDLTLHAGPARDFRDALEWLADYAHVNPVPDSRGHGRRHSDEPSRRSSAAARRPGPTVPTEPDAAARHTLDAYAKGCFDHLRSDAGREVRDWLVETRALPMSVLDHAGVGADPGAWNLSRPDGIPKVSPAAVFPIRHQGQVVFTLSRAVRPLRDRPRWLNTATSVAPNPRTILLEPLRQRATGPVVVTEGMIDALSVLSGDQLAVALLGTGLVDETLADRLAELRRPLLLATDNDAAGRHAHERLTALLAGKGTEVGTLVIPGRFNDINDWHVAARTHWRTTFSAAIRLTQTAATPSISSPGLG